MRDRENPCPVNRGRIKPTAEGTRDLLDSLNDAFPYYFEQVQPDGTTFTICGYNPLSARSLKNARAIVDWAYETSEITPETHKDCVHAISEFQDLLAQKTAASSAQEVVSGLSARCLL